MRVKFMNPFPHSKNVSLIIYDNTVHSYGLEINCGKNVSVDFNFLVDGEIKCCDTKLKRLNKFGEYVNYFNVKDDKIDLEYILNSRLVGDLDAEFLIGCYYLETQNYDMAIGYLKLAIDKNHTDALLTLIDLYENLKRFDDALIYYRRLAEINKAYYYDVAMMCCKIGGLDDDAIEAFQLYIKYYKHIVNPHYKLESIYIKIANICLKNNPELAKLYLQKAAIEFGSIAAYIKLADNYAIRHKNDHIDALFYIKSAIAKTVDLNLNLNVDIYELLCDQFISKNILVNEVIELLLSLSDKYTYVTDILYNYFVNNKITNEWKEHAMIIFLKKSYFNKSEQYYAIGNYYKYNLHNNIRAKEYYEQAIAAGCLQSAFELQDI